ncbi:ABC transporter permease [Gorillibacterium sp. sgz500922]|uniref:ABC transporter permease n=1 Tax=Gorillibacterium sp. sgz500922 TaxID=3446694 RepID=UPI003F675000
MRNFGLLVWNECLKVYKKPGAFVSYLLILLLAVGSALIIHNVAPELFSSASAFTEGMLDKTGTGKLLLILAISNTARIVTQEFRLGTVKFLLIRPHGRAAILASKLAVVLLYSVSVTAAATLLFYAAGSVAFGTSGGEGWLHLLQFAFYQWVYMTIFVLFAFFLGTVSRSSGAAIGAGIFAAMLSELVIPKPFFKYVLFPNADLSVYAAGHPPLAGMSLGFSAAVLIVYAALFVLIAFLSFCKRDVV